MPLELLTRIASFVHLNQSNNTSSFRVSVGSAGEGLITIALMYENCGGMNIPLRITRNIPRRRNGQFKMVI